jgi:hypothetical protein
MKEKPSNFSHRVQILSVSVTNNCHRSVTGQSSSSSRGRTRGGQGRTNGRHGTAGWRIHETAPRLLLNVLRHLLFPPHQERFQLLYFGNCWTRRVYSVHLMLNEGFHAMMQSDSATSRSTAGHCRAVRIHTNTNQVCFDFNNSSFPINDWIRAVRGQQNSPITTELYLLLQLFFSRSLKVILHLRTRLKCPNGLRTIQMCVIVPDGYSYLKPENALEVDWAKSLRWRSGVWTVSKTVRAWCLENWRVGILSRKPLSGSKEGLGVFPHSFSSFNYVQQLSLPPTFVSAKNSQQLPNGLPSSLHICPFEI